MAAIFTVLGIFMSYPARAAPLSPQGHCTFPGRNKTTPFPCHAALCDCPATARALNGTMFPWPVTCHPPLTLSLPRA
ncbi:hypothetical protein AA16373_0179 [Komagataeibacter swingsii DSM 16373]|nr:hypothetical protein AA16373_0179 [Komagataeibacter swingsii DSM 16373]